MKTSISEIQTFLRCRRQWDIGSHQRQNLTVKQGLPSKAFHIGSMVHRILELKAKDIKMSVINNILANDKRQLENDYRKLVGAGWSPEERQEIDDREELVLDMIANYFIHYGNESLGKDYEYKEAELTFQVRIPKTMNYLIGTIDGIAIHKRSGNVWLVEHKTFGQSAAKLEDLRMNYQMLAYCWAARSLLGYSVEGVIYDGLAKKVPGAPEILKSGKGLSKKWIITTAEHYRHEIYKYGFNEEDYEDILTRLEARDRSDDNGFFVRHKIRYSEDELNQFESEIVSITREMASKHVNIYPTVPWTGCWDCSFSELCTAIQTCADTQWILSEKFQQSKGWKTTRTVPVRSLVIEEQ